MSGRVQRAAAEAADCDFVIDADGPEHVVAYCKTHEWSLRDSTFTLPYLLAQIGTHRRAHYLYGDPASTAGSGLCEALGVSE